VTAEEASIGCSTLDEPEGKSQRMDDEKQLKKDECPQHALSGDSASVSQNGRDIPTMEEINSSVSYEGSVLANTANQHMPLKEGMHSKEKETKLSETNLCEKLCPESSRRKEPVVEKTVEDESSKEKFHQRKISWGFGSLTSQEVLSRGGEGSSYSRDAGKVAERREPRNAIENGQSAELSSVKNSLLIEKTEDSKQVEDSADRKPAVRKPKRPSRHASSTVPPVVMPAVSDVVEKRLTEWFTVDSLCFLYGEQKTREMLGQLGGDLVQNFKPLDSATWDPEKHDRFVNICKRLNLLDLEDRSYDEKVCS